MWLTRYVMITELLWLSGAPNPSAAPMQGPEHVDHRPFGNECTSCVGWWAYTWWKRDRERCNFHCQSCVQMCWCSHDECKTWYVQAHHTCSRWIDDCWGTFDGSNFWTCWNERVMNKLVSFVKYKHLLLMYLLLYPLLRLLILGETNMGVADAGTCASAPAAVLGETLAPWTPTSVTVDAAGVSVVKSACMLLSIFDSLWMLLSLVMARFLKVNIIIFGRRITTRNCVTLLSVITLTMLQLILKAKLTSFGLLKAITLGYWILDLWHRISIARLWELIMVRLLPWLLITESMKTCRRLYVAWVKSVISKLKGGILYPAEGQAIDHFLCNLKPAIARLCENNAPIVWWSSLSQVRDKALTFETNKAAMLGTEVKSEVKVTPSISVGVKSAGVKILKGTKPMQRATRNLIRKFLSQRKMESGRPLLHVRSDEARNSMRD